MTDYVSDTHSLIWYLEDDSRLGKAASGAFDSCDSGESLIYVPTICLVEIIYLQEKRKIPLRPKIALDEALRNGASGLLPIALTSEIAHAVGRISRSEVPDMPDRIIAATALHLGLPLLSRDRKIQLSVVETLW